MLDTIKGICNFAHSKYSSDNDFQVKKPPFFLNYILHLDRKRSQSNNNAASSVSLESHLYMQLCLVNGFVYGFSSFCGEFSKKISKSILKKVWLPTIKIADLLFLKTGLKSFKTWNQDIFKTGVSGARSSLFRFTRTGEDQRRVLFLTEALSRALQSLIFKELITDLAQQQV